MVLLNYNDFFYDKEDLIVPDSVDTLYFAWKDAEECSMTFDTDDGSIETWAPGAPVTDNEDGTYTYKDKENTLFAYPVPVKENYRFEGWKCTDGDKWNPWDRI